MIFDCDGTIVDTITDVALSFNAALKQCGFPEHPVEAYGGFVGGNLETIVTRLLPQNARNDKNVDQVKTVYRAIYSQSSKPNTQPYEGVLPMLQRLKEDGFILSVNTNKGQALTDDLLGKLFPNDFFTSIVGYEETRPSKPDPYGVDMICSVCKCTRDDAVYIGDGRSDINTADNAGIPCVFVTWGQGTDEDKMDARIFCVAETVTQLEQQLRNIS